MSVRVRPYKRGGWEVDIRVVLPDGRTLRERRRAPVSSRSGALRWGERRERELVLHPLPNEAKRKEVPTLKAFADRFLDGHARANRHKPSGVTATESLLRVHLIPALGNRKLDSISNEDVQRLKGRLRNRSAKTVNNTLSTLNVLLKVAVEWGVIDKMPCTVRLVRTSQRTMTYHDFDEYGRLIDCATRVDPKAHLGVLLGGDAGLRCGEILGLEWKDVDFSKRQLWVRRSDWKGKVTAPKSDRPRCMPLTVRLADALQAHRHLRGPRVLCRDDGRPLTHAILRSLISRAAARAGLANRGIHVLRHTFCSHLAMRGAPARAIQELAGHQHISTTQRYMHLSPAAVQAAIRLLDEPSPVSVVGDILETGEGRPGEGQ